mmetsp:Transcript_36253/g.102147  ORF Transcript_36253/g.102147 Transcript_36253/m.102147 type:complete len:98 (+) Transcript_36253:303-596(+)|eukprot:CAMPEP_0119141818 /NCGR_PEP_ID=MMETSP1310-20130426/31661_1 /TAXON_ID=464262 /ORGANISM="Genus nov. species nov., Strain RCC2339" /LENGTH=97 /DNA_ID=CAMNT_0007133305 /DNA_START=236 /DNA_END=529 /DNA_ORIENTATION=-
MGNHTESVQIDFDPTVLSFDQVLEQVWGQHNPRSNRDSVQYRNIIFYHNEKQRLAIERSVDELRHQGIKRIATDIRPLNGFTLAEDYHQQYLFRGRA